MSELQRARDIAMAAVTGQGADLQTLAVALMDVIEHVDTKQGEDHPLLVQLRCGVTDPRTDENHPGALLIAVGWIYTPGDPWGLEWTDPKKEDPSEIRVTLVEAIAREFRRLLALLRNLNVAAE